MDLFFARLSSFYRNIKSKIAFYPTLLALTGLFFAFFMIYLEDRGISRYLVDNVPALVVDDGDTALTILSACITGLISMMVFSFSMVMILLNQASTNYSPRLLPGLISDKNHQVILGIYLSSILYCLFILLSIQPTGDKYQIPGFSVLLGIVLTVVCIYAFIYFIHNISQHIQITNILTRIFVTARKSLQDLLEKEKGSKDIFPETGEWYEYHTESSGYFQDFSESNLLDFCQQQETMIEILPVKGMFVLQGIPVIRCRKKLDEDELKRVLNNIYFSRQELVTKNYVLAFKQITEVIVKAMSPGINDPGTALNAIDYLTELLRLRMMIADTGLLSKQGQNLIKVRTVKFEELLYNVLASIRTYCKQDIIVVQKLGIMFHYLKSQQAKNPYYYDILDTEARRLLQDAQNVLDNKTDLDVIAGLAKKLHLRLDPKSRKTITQ